MTDERRMQEVLTRLGAARRLGDPLDVAALFVGQAVLEIVFSAADDDALPLLAVSGAEEIGQALTTPPDRLSQLWSHHSTHDHVVAVQGDFGRVDAQFLLLGMATGSGSVEPVATPVLHAIEAGSYHADLRRTPEGWKIWRLRIARNWPLPVRVNFADDRP